MDDFKQPAQSRGLLQQCNNKTDRGNRGSTVLGQHQQEKEETGKEVREITLLSLLNKESHYAPQNLKWVHSNLKSLSLRNLGIGITQSAGRLRYFLKKLGKDKCRSDHPRDGKRFETSPERRTSSVEGTK